MPWVRGEPAGDAYEQHDLPMLASDFRECVLVASYIISPSDIKKVNVRRSNRHNPSVSETEASSDESTNDSTSPPSSSSSPSEPSTDEEALTIPTPPPFSEPDVSADDVLNVFDLGK